MKVTLNYFKPSGKWYTEAVVDAPVEHYWEVADWLRNEEKSHPGLMATWDEGFILIRGENENDFFYMLNLEKERKTDGAAQLVLRELARARGKFPDFNSPHEGYAVLLEEVDELWEAVKFGTPDEAADEAIQVAAMGLRFLTDCTEIE